MYIDTDIYAYDKFWRKGGSYELPIEVFYEILSEIDYLRNDIRILMDIIDSNDIEVSPREIDVWEKWYYFLKKDDDDDI